MDSGVSSIIKKSFDLKDVDINTYSPLTFAYIGDSIYALVAKTVLVQTANVPANKLHNATVKYVSAVAQAKIYRFFQDNDILSEAEASIMRRGRNAKSHSTAKNASVSDYRMATGIEALCGWLYLRGEEDRMIELLKLGFEYLDSIK